MILGLDLSTRAAAAVCCPLDWDGRWSRVRSLVVGEALRRDATDAERARRTARKLLLGKVPRSGAKDAVVATLRAAGAMFETADEADAYCCANLGLSQLGGYFFGQAPA